MPKGKMPYEVGYGKPPRENRFEAGRSGNPKGRPKGSRNLTTIVLQESRKKVRANGPRGVVEMTKLEAAVLQLVNKAAQGDLRATREYIALVQRSEESEKSASTSPEVHESDKKVVEGFLRRMGKAARTAVVDGTTGSTE
jgi:hypothetical protein